MLQDIGLVARGPVVNVDESRTHLQQDLLVTVRKTVGKLAYNA